MSGEVTQPVTSSSAGRTGIRTFLLVIAGGLIAWCVCTSVVMVDETEVVLIERLGRLSAVYDREEDRGLHFKLPWPLDVSRSIDRRVRLFDPPGRELFTRDKKNITVDTYVCWRIATDTETDAEDLTQRPAVRFFRSLGSTDVTEARLDTRVRSIVTAAVGRIDLSSLLTADNSEQGPGDASKGMLSELSQEILREINQPTGDRQSIQDELGIEIVDVRIQRINLPVGNQQAVFDRMKSERRKIAERYRSAGLAESAVIRSRADREYSDIIARANAEAERIRGRADAEAAKTLNAAHSEAPEFYESLRTLEAYRQIINERTTLVLSSQSPLFRLLTQGVPGEAVGTDAAESSTDPDSSTDESVERPRSETTPELSSGPE